MRPLYLCIATALAITTASPAHSHITFPNKIPETPRTVSASLSSVQPQPPSRAKAEAPGPLPADRLCRALQHNAMGRDLPAVFFVRLIWQESRFDHTAVSKVGAQGIAQFMPPTAREMGLKNPFDPAMSLKKSAELLADLVGRFGNVGLAAAAYNAGPRRVKNWLKGKGSLPHETKHYVKVTTGKRAEHWRKTVADIAPLDVDSESEPAGPYSYALEDWCLTLASKVLKSPWPNGAWNVRVAEDVSQREALRRVARLNERLESKDEEARALVDPIDGAEPDGRPRFAVDIAVPTRKEAWEMCSQMRKRGEGCRILRG